MTKTYDERMAAIHRPWQKCPVCLGKGIVPQGFYMTPGWEGFATSTSPDPCRSCDGRGIVR